jgi:hypothetical protein
MRIALSPVGAVQARLGRAVKGGIERGPFGTIPAYSSWVGKINKRPEPPLWGWFSRLQSRDTSEGPERFR